MAPQAGCGQTASRAMDCRPTVEALRESLLLYMGRTGCIRPWRIGPQAMPVADGLPPAAGVTRRAWQSLLDAAWIQPIRSAGQALGWHYRQGRPRRLLELTLQGRHGYRLRTGSEPAASELAWALRFHTSLRHALAILEARDHLRARDIPVVDDPLPCPRLSADPGGPRSEPDLVAYYRERVYPVEVQRAVGARYLSKWIKSLELFQRLMLITFTENSCRRQGQQLLDARLRRQLPDGVILMSSLERLEQGAVAFSEL